MRIRRFWKKIKTNLMSLEVLRSYYTYIAWVCDSSAIYHIFLSCSICTYVFWHMSHTRQDMLPQKIKIWFKWKYWVHRRLISWCPIPASLRIQIILAYSRCFLYTYGTWEPNNVVSIIYNLNIRNLAIILSKCKMSHISHFTSKPYNA